MQEIRKALDTILFELKDINDWLIKHTKKLDMIYVKYEEIKQFLEMKETLLEMMQVFSEHQRELNKICDELLESTGGEINCILVEKLVELDSIIVDSGSYKTQDEKIIVLILISTADAFDKTKKEIEGFSEYLEIYLQNIDTLISIASESEEVSTLYATFLNGFRFKDCYQLPSIQTELNIEIAFKRLKIGLNDPLVLSYIDRVLALGKLILNRKFTFLCIQSAIIKNKSPQLNSDHLVDVLGYIGPEIGRFIRERDELIDKVSSCYDKTLVMGTKENRHEQNAHLDEAKGVPVAFVESTVNHAPRHASKIAYYKKTQSRQRQAILLCSNAYPGNFMSKKTRNQIQKTNETVWRDVPSRSPSPSG